MVSFLKYRLIYFIISTVVILMGLISIAVWKYNYSIDFVGGTNLEYELQNTAKTKDVEKILVKENLNIVNFSINEKNLFIRTKPIDEKKETELRNSLQKNLQTKIIVSRFETVGPILGRETMIKTLIASLLAIGGILIYMSFAFKSFNFALSAIIALLHDFLVVMGSYSLMSHFLGAQVDTLFVTAVLTTMSFSVHDTIIIFDKIREYLKYDKGDIEELSNKALTETLVRSLNNSMTIIFMLLSLTLLGGTTIKFFVATLLIGTITGTYSSPFVATPVLVWLEKRKKINK